MESIYETYLALLVPVPGVFAFCFGVPYQVFTDKQDFDYTEMVKVVSEFKPSLKDAQHLFLLERAGCGTKCVYDGTGLSFVMDDLTQFRKMQFVRQEGFAQWFANKNEQ